MDVRNELKSIIAKRGKTFKKVCELVSTKTKNPKFNSNNISSKISRKTISFCEIELMLEELGYKIQFVEDKD